MSSQPHSPNSKPGRQSNHRDRDPGHCGARDIALFDFDHTLITTNSLGHLFRFLDGAPPYKRVLREAGHWLRVRDLTDYVALKTAIKTHLYRHVLKGHPVTALAAAAKVAATKLTINPDSLAVYREAEAKGLSRVIVTASPTAFIVPLLPLLGIATDHVIGTDLEADSAGRLTGKFDGPECIRTAKPGKVKAYIDALPAGSKIALAVGNPPDDDALLAMAPRAIAVSKTTGAHTHLPATPQT